MWQPVAAVRGRTPNAWWRTLVAALAVVVLIVGFIAVAGALSSADTSFVVAQLISRGGGDPDQAKLVATGFGRATAPAETATLQLVIVPSGDQFNNPGFRPTPEASPEAGEDALAAPVVDAIMAHGIDRDAISVVVSPVYGNASFYGGGATTGFRLDIHLDASGIETLNTLMEAAYLAASESGMYVSAQGVRYGVTGCDALEQQARGAAIADAQRQAAQQTSALGVQLGKLVEVADAPPGGAPLATCADTAPVADQMDVTNPYVFNPGGVVLDAPSYNPARIPEAVAEFRVELTYGLERSTKRSGR